MGAVKRNLQLDASEPDACAYSMMQTAYIKLCAQWGWNFVEKAQNAAVKHTVAVLQPLKLKI